MALSIKRISCFVIALIMCVYSLPFHVSAKDEKYVAITFDDGPHPKYTERILDLLGKYKIKATFFVIGFNAEQWPSIVEREIAEGHEVGNHTYSHNHDNAVNKKNLHYDMVLTDSLLGGKFGYQTSLFRPPEGLCNDIVKSVAKELDYSIILWDVDTRDWAKTPSDVIVSTVKREVESGDIILFHDYTAGKCETVDALEKLIPWFIEEGYTFVTVSELYLLESEQR